MSVFIDTSAFLAVLNSVDENHPSARRAWEQIIAADNTLLTSNYILVETSALLQHRFGMHALRLFENDIQPLLQTLWVDEGIHRQAVSALLAANRRNLSLVDCTSFELLRSNFITRVFTFDHHFQEQGFIIINDRIMFVGDL
jgi:predicted nucleic acid-binding protein